MVMSLSIHVADKMSIILDDDNSAAAHGRRHGSRSPPSHLCTQLGHGNAGEEKAKNPWRMSYLEIQEE